MSTPRIALVTGASSGIGRAAAIALNAAGWTVILSARRKEILEETVGLMEEGGRARTSIVVGDLGRPEDVKTLFEVVRNDFSESMKSEVRLNLTRSAGFALQCAQIALGSYGVQADSFGLECRYWFPEGPDGGDRPRNFPVRYERQRHSVIPVRAGGDPDHEGANTTRRTVRPPCHYIRPFAHAGQHHQQRLDIRLCPPSIIYCVHHVEACDTRHDEMHSTGL